MGLGYAEGYRLRADEGRGDGGEVVGRGGGGFVSPQLGNRQHGAKGLAREKVAIEAWLRTARASELGLGLGLELGLG